MFVCLHVCVSRLAHFSWLFAKKLAENFALAIVYPFLHQSLTPDREVGTFSDVQFFETKLVRKIGHTSTPVLTFFVSHEFCFTFHCSQCFPPHPFPLVFIFGVGGFLVSSGFLCQPFSILCGRGLAVSKRRVQDPFIQTNYFHK